AMGIQSASASHSPAFVVLEVTTSFSHRLTTRPYAHYCFAPSPPRQATGLAISASTLLLGLGVLDGGLHAVNPRLVDLGLEPVRDRLLGGRPELGEFGRCRRVDVDALLHQGLDTLGREDAVD